MRLFSGTVIANNEILPGVHLLEVYAEQLARAAQPGQYCMLRCCDSLASDPLLRRPFFVAEVEPERSLCRLLVYRRGRASAWLASQQAGMPLDMLGPLGHGWVIRPETRNLLLVGEDPLLAAPLFLARSALESELAVTFIHCAASMEQSYPAALLPPEVEYQVFTDLERPVELARQIGAYLAWADAACCSVSEELLATLVRAHPRWGERHFAQAVLARPLPCASGVCLACQIEARREPRLVCRDGPVFALNELAALR